jgi:V/A-type H+/Na+-transporting ATPase subunit B
VAQGMDDRRELGETFDRVWQALAVLPRRELTMIAADELDAHHREAP